MNRRRLACSLVLVAVLVTCATGESTASPGTEVVSEIAKCGSTICHIKAICKGTNGSSICVCKQGYEGDGNNSCKDVNECVKNLHDCPASAVCNNTEGSYECACKNKLELTSDRKGCADLCTTKIPGKKLKCGKNEICAVKEDKKADCYCVKGFHFQYGRCRDSNECTERTHNCSHQSYCRNTVGGFKCVCPKGFESTGVHCIPNDVTRWTTPKFLLKDIMDGVLSRIIAVGAAAIIVLSLFVIVVLSCKRKCIKWAEQREMKRLAYEEQLMVAAGLYDPDQMFLAEGEMAYPGNEMLYPEEMGFPPEDIGYPAGEMGYPPGEMGYPPGEIGYPPGEMGYPPGEMGYLPGEMGYPTEGMGYMEDGMGYADNMGYTKDNSMGEPTIGPMTTAENFDQMVPHTYYEDDQDEASDVEGEAY